MTELTICFLLVSLLPITLTCMCCPSPWKGTTVCWIKKDYFGFPGGSMLKNPPAHARRRRRLRFNPWVRKIPWRRKWQPTPVFLHGKFHGQGSLAGYSPYDCKESDTTENTSVIKLSGFPSGSAGKESACNVRDMGLIL